MANNPSRAAGRRLGDWFLVAGMYFDSTGSIPRNWKGNSVNRTNEMETTSRTELQLNSNFRLSCQ